METQVYLNIKRILEMLKEEMENNISFIQSEIVEINKPSMMGNSGLYYYLDTENSGLAIFFYDSGVVEIATDLVDFDGEDNLFFSYAPESISNEIYPIKSFILFREKLKELLFLLKGKYPNMRTLVF